MFRIIAAVLVPLVLAFEVPAAQAQSLKGSRASLNRQNEQARRHDYSYLQTTRDVRRFIDLGLLVPVRGNANYELASVSFPYARPEVKTFVERLGAQYRAACGEKLVVTSLTRPETRQPRNASALSVHPTGMALDLRFSRRASCRNWLEGVLVSLERRGVLEATRERRPPHYHVALFPQPYMAYVSGLGGGARLASNESAAPAAPERADATATYKVRRGDSLWTIARRHGTTVNQLKQVNGLESGRIFAGQVIQVPSGR